MALSLLVPLLPLLSTLVVLAGDRGRLQQSARYGAIPLAVAFVGAAACLWVVATRGAYVVRFYDPAAIANVALPMGFEFDRLSTVMMVLISGVATLIFHYSIRYMYQEPGYVRFLALIGLTAFTLLCMVASVNLVMLFVFWQILSYLLSLLAHNLGHSPTREGARRTFWFLRFGDAAFLLGIVLAHSLYGTIEFSELFRRAATHLATVGILPGLSIGGPTAVTLLLLVGAMSKSAQFPLHVWLPRFLYAPTPVTALLHAGIINAAGFLINRLAPLYQLSPTTLHVAFVVGAITTFFGASTMLTQNDIKNTLGFSTIGQMGYMVMECGLGAFALAVFHLIAHGLFKASMFLDCGNVIHKARQEPAIPPRAFQDVEFHKLSWATGFFTTLLMPLVILLVAHGALRIPLLNSQGAVIFLFFIWVTTTQALLTLTRLRAVASWKVSGAMLLTLLVVVFTYLFAAERFTAFLYPDPATVEGFFGAAALPGPLFDLLVGATAVLILLGWIYVYAGSRGKRVRLPGFAQALGRQLYVLFLDHLYVEVCYAKLARCCARIALWLRPGAIERWP